MISSLKYPTICLVTVLSLFSNHCLFAGQIALTGVNLVSIEQQKILNGMTIIMEDKRIKEIVKSDRYKPGKDVVVVNLKDKFVIPGLIDGHVHHATDPEAWDDMDTTLPRLQNLLRGGVTSVRDMGGDVRVLTYLKRQAQLDLIQSPDIYYSVIIGGPEFFSDPRTIASAKGHKSGTTVWMRSVTASSDFDAVALEAKGAGATGLKIYADVPASIIKSLSAAGKKHGLKVWGHTFVGPDKPSESVIDGLEVMSHISDFSGEHISDFKSWRRKKGKVSETELNKAYQPESYTQLIDSLKKENVILDATLLVFQQRMHTSDTRKHLYKLATMFTHLAHKAGIEISAGTDAFSDDRNPHPRIYDELDLLVNDGGLTPIEALKAATLSNARVLGIQNDYGSVSAGKVANLVVLDENPIEDVKAIRTVSHVIKNGDFVYRGDNPSLPFSSAKRVGETLWMSGQIGNLPGTMVLAGDSIEVQMTQTMKNIGSVLLEHGLTYKDVTKCTLMLADINDWKQASDVYRKFFKSPLPTRSAFATTGLALGSKLEVECIAHFI